MGDVGGGSGGVLSMGIMPAGLGLIGSGGDVGNLNMGFGNFLGDITGSNRAADAAQAAAMAQMQMARQTRQQVLDYSSGLEQDAMKLAEASPEELAALDRSFASAQQGLAREERLLNAIDPALMEASQQALNLLRGESAAINKPMMDLRNAQRQQLLNSLRSQYGPGAESSSIGQRALRQFDLESNAQFAQNQGNALNQAFGIASQDFGSRLQRGISGLQQVGQGYGALQERKLNTRLNVGAQTLGALSGTSQQMIQSAGAPYVGEALRGQAQSALFNQGAKLGTMALMG